jgi:hypothetical protein
MVVTERQVCLYFNAQLTKQKNIVVNIFKQEEI